VLTNRTPIKTVLIAITVLTIVTVLAVMPVLTLYAVGYIDTLVQ